MDSATRLQEQTVFTGKAQRSRQLNVSAATSITVGTSLVRGTVNTANGSYALTLPNVSEAAGMIVCVCATVANAKTLTVQDNDESLEWSDLVLDVDEDYALLYSDGERWHTLVNGIAP